MDVPLQKRVKQEKKGTNGLKEKPKKNKTKQKKQNKTKQSKTEFTGTKLP